MKDLEFSNEGDDQARFSSRENFVNIEIRNYHVGGYQDIYLDNEEVKLLIEFLKKHLEINDKN